MKKVKIIVLVIVLLAIAVGIILIVNNRNVVVREKGDAEKVSTKEWTKEGDGTLQLSAPADSEEEAKGIADMYGITYIGYYRGYGQYETEKNYDDLKALAQENNFPDLEILYKSFTK